MSLRQPSRPLDLTLAIVFTLLLVLGVGALSFFTLLLRWGLGCDGCDERLLEISTLIALWAPVVIALASTVIMIVFAARRRTAYPVPLIGAGAALLIWAVSAGFALVLGSV